MNSMSVPATLYQVYVTRGDFRHKESVKIDRLHIPDPIDPLKGIIVNSLFDNSNSWNPQKGKFSKPLEVSYQSQPDLWVRQVDCNYPYGLRFFEYPVAVSHTAVTISKEFYDNVRALADLKEQQKLLQEQEIVLNGDPNAWISRMQKKDTVLEYSPSLAESLHSITSTSSLNEETVTAIIAQRNFALERFEGYKLAQAGNPPEIYFPDHLLGLSTRIKGYESGSQEQNLSLFVSCCEGITRNITRGPEYAVKIPLSVFSKIEDFSKAFIAFRIDEVSLYRKLRSHLSHCEGRRVSIFNSKQHPDTYQIEPTCRKKDEGKELTYTLGYRINDPRSTDYLKGIHAVRIKSILEDRHCGLRELYFPSLGKGVYLVNDMAKVRFFTGEQHPTIKVNSETTDVQIPTNLIERLEALEVMRREVREKRDVLRNDPMIKAIFRTFYASVCDQQPSVIESSSNNPKKVVVFSK